MAADHPQRIVRLTPLSAGYASIDRLVRPASPRLIATSAALGRTVARNVTAATPQPSSAIAAIDGWAVRSEDTYDAGPYAPTPLTPPPVRVNTGDPVPAGADAIAIDDIVGRRGAGWEISAGVTAGDGILPAGVDAGPDTPVVLAGRRLRQTDIAALAALGIAELTITEPRIRVAPARNDARLATLAAALADLAHADGAVVELMTADAGPAAALTSGDADFIVLVGGTGTGVHDTSVTTLAARGEVEFHGVALGPGETTAFGTIETTPVLVAQGRLDAALAGWLTFGRRVVARLCGRAPDEPVLSRVLSRKVASCLGMAEMVLLTHDGEAVAPMLIGYLSPSALAKADGYTLVPADSEGYPAGTRIEMRLLP